MRLCTSVNALRYEGRRTEKYSPNPPIVRPIPPSVGVKGPDALFFKKQEDRKKKKKNSLQLRVTLVLRITSAAEILTCEHNYRTCIIL